MESLLDLKNSTVKEGPIVPISNGINDKAGLDLLQGSTAVTITVGEHHGATSTWILPKKLLTRHSPFFAAALDGRFAEAVSQSVKLPEDDREAFADCVQWLYLGTFNRVMPGINITAWVLGDKLGSDAFCNCAMGKLTSWHGINPLQTSTVRSIYQQSMRGSALRNWVSEECCSHVEKGWIPSPSQDWELLVETETEFAIDVAKATIKCAERRASPFK